MENSGVENEQCGSSPSSNGENLDLGLDDCLPQSESTESETVSLLNSLLRSKTQPFGDRTGTTSTQENRAKLDGESKLPDKLISRSLSSGHRSEGEVEVDEVSLPFKKRRVGVSSVLTASNCEPSKDLAPSLEKELQTNDHEETQILDRLSENSVVERNVSIKNDENQCEKTNSDAKVFSTIKRKSKPEERSITQTVQSSQAKVRVEVKEEIWQSDVVGLVPDINCVKIPGYIAGLRLAMSFLNIEGCHMFMSYCRRSRQKVLCQLAGDDLRHVLNVQSYILQQLMEASSAQLAPIEDKIYDNGCYRISQCPNKQFVRELMKLSTSIREQVTIEIGKISEEKIKADSNGSILRASIASCIYDEEQL